MRILADENIPLVHEFFAGFGEVITRPGRGMGAEEVKEADALIVRSVTQVNRNLLEGSRVRFVGTCTIGTDHLDTPYLAGAGIDYASAPGCNANSVVEYVFSVLARLRPGWQRQSFGIVGCGNVGGALYRRLKALGCRVRFFDPLLDLAERPELDPADRVPLYSVLEADVVCCHAPLTRTGAYPSHHLISDEALGRLREDSLLINAGRGAVIDNRALLAHLIRRPSQQVVLDVWEGEPAIDPQLLSRVCLGTPHIAGYSYDGKVAGTAMIYAALCRSLGREAVLTAEALMAELSITGSMNTNFLSAECLKAADSEEALLSAAILSAYDVAADDRRLREAVAQSDGDPQAIAQAFDGLRKHYPTRREFPAQTLVWGDNPALPISPELSRILTTLGFTLGKG